MTETDGNDQGEAPALGLSRLFKILFTADHLALFLRERVEEVSQGVQLNASLDKLAFDAAEAIEKRGLVQRPLYRALLSARPRKRPQIHDFFRGHLSEQDLAEDIERALLDEIQEWLKSHGPLAELSREELAERRSRVREYEVEIDRLEGAEPGAPIDAVRAELSDERAQIEDEMRWREIEERLEQFPDPAKVSADDLRDRLVDLDRRLEELASPRANAPAQLVRRVSELRNVFAAALAAHERRARLLQVVGAVLGLVAILAGLRFTCLVPWTREPCRCALSEAGLQATRADGRVLVELAETTVLASTVEIVAATAACTAREAPDVDVRFTAGPTRYPVPNGTGLHLGGAGNDPLCAFDGTHCDARLRDVADANATTFTVSVPQCVEAALSQDNLAPIPVYLLQLQLEDVVGEIELRLADDRPACAAWRTPCPESSPAQVCFASLHSFGYGTDAPSKDVIRLQGIVVDGQTADVTETDGPIWTVRRPPDDDCKQQLASASLAVSNTNGTLMVELDDPRKIEEALAKVAQADACADAGAPQVSLAFTVGPTDHPLPAGTGLWGATSEDAQLCTFEDSRCRVQLPDVVKAAPTPPFELRIPDCTAESLEAESLATPPVHVLGIDASGGSAAIAVGIELVYAEGIPDCSVWTVTCPSGTAASACFASLRPFVFGSGPAEDSVRVRSIKIGGRVADVSDVEGDVWTVRTRQRTNPVCALSLRSACNGVANWCRDEIERIGVAGSSSERRRVRNCQAFLRANRDGNGPQQCGCTQ